MSTQIVSVGTTRTGYAVSIQQRLVDSKMRYFLVEGGLEAQVWFHSISAANNAKRAIMEERRHDAEKILSQASEAIEELGFYTDDAEDVISELKDTIESLVEQLKEVREELASSQGGV